MTSEDQKENGKLNRTTDMDNCMLGVFLDHLAQGRKTPQGWKKFTYNAIRDALKDELDERVTISHIKNRIKTMRKHTSKYKVLKASFSGFGYNPDTGCLTADEQVWTDAIKANPNVKGYRNKQLPRLNEWMDVLGDSVAVGNIQKTSSTADVDANTEERYNTNTTDTWLGDQYTFESPLTQSTQFDYFPLDDDNRNNDTPISSSMQSGKASKLQSRKRKTVASGLKEEFGGMRGAIESFVDAVKEKNQYDDKIWDQISDAIYAIEDMDEDTQLEALDLFSGDGVENLKKCFLRIPVHKRKEWLLKKLNI